MKRILVTICFLFNLLTYSQQPEYEVINTTVNSKFAELGVTFLTSNEVIFASSKKDASDKNFLKTRRKNNRQGYLDFYKATISPEGNLVQTAKFSNEQNNKVFESDITFSNDLKTAYFTWNNFYNTTSRLDSAKWQTLHIVKADVSENFELQNFQQLPFNSENYSVRNPRLSPDGKKLFFVSDMPGGFGKTDIYVVNILNNGTYSKPKNLGPYINTTEVELFPFIDNNNTLYFSSYGRKGLGDLDIYKSEYKNGSYQPVEHLPAPINSNYDDFAYVTLSDGEDGYISSNRRGGKGDADIYYFKQKKEVCLQEIAFKFFNEDTNASLTNVNISITENGAEIDSFLGKIEANPSYQFECGKTYKLLLEKEGFETVYLTLNIENKPNTTKEQLVYFKPFLCKVEISGIVTDIETQELLPNTDIVLFHNKNEVAKTSTNENAYFSFEVDCNKKYRIVAQKTSYITKESYFSSNKKNDAAIVQNFELKNAVCNQIITGVVSDIVTNEQLANVSVSLLKKDEIIKTITTANNGKFRFEIGCNEKYRLKVEKENFVTFEESFSTNNKHKNIIPKSIKLKSDVCYQRISGIITDIETQNVLSNVQVQLSKNNEIIDTAVSNNNGVYSFTVNCASNYILKVVNEHYNNYLFEFSTNNKHLNSLTHNIQLQSSICKQKLEGIVTDMNTQDVLPNAKIVLFENGSQIATQVVGNDGKFSFEVNCNKSYQIETSISDYTSSKTVIETNNIKHYTITKNVLLKPTICEQYLKGVVTDFDTGEKISNCSVIFSVNGTKVGDVTTNESGEYQFKVDCNKNYTISLVKENYFTNTTNVVTNNINTFTSKKNFKLKSSICNQTVSGLVYNIDTKEPIANALILVNLDGNTVINVKTNANGLYTFKVNCKKRYSITVNAENYYSKEMNIETNNIHNTSIEQNINLKSTICNQFVKGIVINKDTKDIITNAEVSLIMDDNIIDTSSVNNHGEFVFKLDCNQKYTLNIAAKNYTSTKIEINTNSIHNTEIKKNILLESLICYQTLNISVKNEFTNVPVSNAEITVIKNESDIETYTTSNNGNLKLKLDCEASYQIAIQKSGFKNFSKSFNTDTKKYKNSTEQVKLRPLTCSQPISISVIDLMTKKPIQNAKVEVNNETVYTNKGVLNYTLECKNEYNFNIIAENYLSNYFKVSGFNSPRGVLKYTIQLIPATEIITINNVNMLRLKTIPFDLDNDEITRNAAIKLKSVADFLKSYPEYNIEIKNHTDSRAPDNYNLTLSEKRAQSILNYLISQGINPERLSAKGMGETELVNKCKNGVKCTEAEHQANRRTEFILKNY